MSHGDGFVVRELQELYWQDSQHRERTLTRLRENGSKLAAVEEYLRHDPDVVLAAVGSCPEAVNFAGRNLLRKQTWVLEAVHRNWRVLEHVPDSCRASSSIVMAAARRSLEALQFAAAPLCDDAQFRAAVLSSEDRYRELTYEGEHLRLVGPFNRWRTTDSAVRFRKLARKNSPAKSEVGGTGVNRDVGAPGADTVQHQLSVCLEDGCVDFQIVSCIREFAFQVIPAKEYGKRSQCILVADDPNSVLADVSDDKSLMDSTFCIQEKKTTCVSIFVEIVKSRAQSQMPQPDQGLQRFAKVWYIVERRPSQCPGLIMLKQDEHFIMPKPSPKTTSHDMCEAERKLPAKIEVPQEDVAVSSVEEVKELETPSFERQAPQIPADVELIENADAMPEFRYLVS
eukprot:gnl/TRDRNA2_/TRDRNA2_169363_c0_seq3.p1 gnl/TRDRNA2_/TRDRNA2_169363_c0~~gnl/TRDRNA2_/TRDRNA2_169363_c0_seq3.p1  ORF type:complete len:417 (-),score=82.25 gnl/TRDRNA2_/TRDRNA2_169363_c0_seq3:13-1206(-)